MRKMHCLLSAWKTSCKRSFVPALLLSQVWSLLPLNSHLQRLISNVFMPSGIRSRALFFFMKRERERVCLVFETERMLLLPANYSVLFLKNGNAYTYKCMADGKSLGKSLLPFYRTMPWNLNMYSQGKTRERNQRYLYSGLKREWTFVLFSSNDNVSKTKSLFLVILRLNVGSWCF